MRKYNLGVISSNHYGDRSAIGHKTTESPFNHIPFGNFPTGRSDRPFHHEDEDFMAISASHETRMKEDKLIGKITTKLNVLTDSNGREFVRFYSTEVEKKNE